MTPDLQIVRMTVSIKQAIKVMGDRFGSTEQDVARAIEGLKASMQAASQPSPSVETAPPMDSRLPQSMAVSVGT